MSQLSHYDTLQVDELASAQQIREAFRRLAREHHPDRSGGDESSDRMARINQAYEVLSDTARRAQYDQTRSEAAARAQRRGHLAQARAAADDADRRLRWMMLGSVALVTLAVLVWVASRTLVPRPAPAPVAVPALGAVPRLSEMAHTAAQAPTEEPLVLVPTRTIEPWKPPPETARVVLAETEPVARLMREGVMKNPPSRKYEAQ